MTEKKQMEEVLKENVDRYRQIFDNHVAASIYCRPIFDENKKSLDYQVVDVNPAYERFIGLKRTDMVGKLATGIEMNPSSLNPADLIESIGNTALSQIPNHFDLYLQRANKWFDITLYSPQRGYAVAVFFDITARKQDEAELRRTQERLLEAQEFAKLGYWEVDTKSGKNFWSDEMFRIGGFKPQEFKPTIIDLMKAVHPQDKEFVLRIMQEILNGNECEFDFRIIRQDNEIIWIHEKVKYEYNASGNLVRWYGVVQDITQRKQSEENLKESEESLRRAMETAETANKAKSMFLANMSHEIRTPLNGILGMAQLLGLSLQGEEKEMADTIVTCGNNLCSIINDILDLSKIEAGKVSLIQEEFEIIGLVSKVNKVIELLAEKKGLEYKFHIDQGIKGHLMGDPGRLTQILLNLLGNAIKFTQDGSVELSIGIGKEFEDKLQLIFSIKDTGIGISAENMGRLFTDFMQIDNSYTKKYQGTGLGLAISKHLVGMMDGEINVDSQLGKGSNFTFSAIFKWKTGIQELITIAKEDEPQLFSTGAAVLLVEDDDPSGELIKKLCLSKNINLKIATDGKQALEILEHESFKIVFMDVQMPNMSGFEVTRIIRDIEKPRHRHTPIVATTANALVGDKQKCIEAGMDDYIEKPIKIDKFFAILEKYISKKETG